MAYDDAFKNKNEARHYDTEDEKFDSTKPSLSDVNNGPAQQNM